LSLTEIVKQFLNLSRDPKFYLDMAIILKSLDCLTTYIGLTFKREVLIDGLWWTLECVEKNKYVLWWFNLHPIWGLPLGLIMAFLGAVIPFYLIYRYSDVIPAMWVIDIVMAIVLFSIAWVVTDNINHIWRVLTW
jgi:hypothetical protein